jgi:copper chaperone CopZ
MTPSPWYDYSYLPCQFCVGKNHCAQCGGDIRQALLNMEGVEGVEMDVPARRLRLTLEGVDPDGIVDQADALGVFL